MEIMLQVNGVKRKVLIETDEMLLETLRNLGFYSVVVVVIPLTVVFAQCG